MISMVEIIPSLPAQTFQELKIKTGLVRGLVSTFQIDVADGMFVTSRSWPMNPGDKEQFKRLVRGDEKLPFSDEIFYEVHFMAHNPEKLLPDWIRLGVVRAFFHIEARHDFSELSALATKGEVELGVSLKIGTPIERIDQYMQNISVVQLMGIDAIGMQGQPFDERVIDMIRAVKARYPNVTIQVDGSVNRETGPSLVQAGASRLAPGSFVLSSDDPAAAIDTLKHVAIFE